MNIHIQTNHTVPLLRVQAQVVQSRPCANASATLYSSARQRAYLGNTCSTSYRIAASSRRIGAATLQAALDNYVADVPVAGQQVSTIDGALDALALTLFFFHRYAASSQQLPAGITSLLAT